MADLVDAVRISKPNVPGELTDLYFPAKQEVTGPNGGAIPVDIGSATLSVTADGVEIKNDSGNPIPTVEGLSIPEHDYIALSYTGSNLTGVEYKDGGAGGTTVATLTLAYDGSDNLTSVTKS
jgi:hypothetical protein